MRFIYYIYSECIDKFLISIIEKYTCTSYTSEVENILLILFFTIILINCINSTYRFLLITHFKSNISLSRSRVMDISIIVAIEIHVNRDVQKSKSLARFRFSACSRHKSVYSNNHTLVYRKKQLTENFFIGELKEITTVSIRARSLR